MRRLHRGWVATEKNLIERLDFCRKETFTCVLTVCEFNTKPYLRLIVSQLIPKTRGVPSFRKEMNRTRNHTWCRIVEKTSKAASDIPEPSAVPVPFLALSLHWCPKSVFYSPAFCWKVDKNHPELPLEVQRSVPFQTFSSLCLCIRNRNRSYIVLPGVGMLKALQVASRRPEVHAVLYLSSINLSVRANSQYGTHPRSASVQLTRVCTQ